MARVVSEQRRQTLTQMREKWQAIAAERREAQFDEFLFLIQSGSSADQAARRLGTNPVAMARQAYRWHRTDIVQYLSSATYRQRHGL